MSLCFQSNLSRLFFENAKFATLKLSIPHFWQQDFSSTFPFEVIPNDEGV